MPIVLCVSKFRHPAICVCVLYRRRFRGVAGRARRWRMTVTSCARRCLSSQWRGCQRWWSRVPCKVSLLVHECPSLQEVPFHCQHFNVVSCIQCECISGEISESPLMQRPSPTCHHLSQKRGWGAFQKEYMGSVFFIMCCVCFGIHHGWGAFQKEYTQVLCFLLCDGCALEASALKLSRIVECVV